MLFSDFAQYLQKLETISSRLEITAILAELYNQLDLDEIKPTSYLLQGSLVPAYESLEFQLSSKMVMRALARLNGGESSNLFGETSEKEDPTQVLALYKKIGDLGVVAETLFLTEKKVTSKLSINQVYQQLRAIASQSGAGSQEQKLEGLVQLLQQLDGISAKYVVRIVMGNLRLGFSTMTMLDALSWAVTGGKTEHDWLEDAYQKKADIGELAATYLASKKASADSRQKTLAEYSVEVGIPVLPALCQRLNSSAEIIAKMGEVLAEPKYDGVRVQIHYQKGQPVRTFTRSLEENSHQFPELFSAVEKLNCQSCILDGEAIGYDKTTGKLLPFQDTITRKRKHEVEARAAAVPLRFYIFDVLSLNNTSLINQKLRDRKDVLKNLFKENEVFKHAPFIITTSPEVLHDFHTQSLAEGLEGAVIKQLDSPYQSGRKGWSWVKIKEEEGSRGKLSDTLDCVVMGYYVGRGKRTAFGVGAFLVGVLNIEGQLKTIAKIGTGLSDDQFKELKTRTDSLIVNEMPGLYEVPKALTPDVWLKPALVVEIAADEITHSPTHTASVALRFPRLVRFRDDKTWEQATTTTEVKQIMGASSS